MKISKHRRNFVAGGGGLALVTICLIIIRNFLVVVRNLRLYFAGKNG
jgi:hypothetical protein